jgi:hypothetical protein
MDSGRLSNEQITEFMEKGFVNLRRVVPHKEIAAGQRVIWSDLGMSPDDPSTWTEPVRRLVPSDPRPFDAAINNDGLTFAFDQLVGAGNWIPRRDLGIFVIRLPSDLDPGDTGWHIDSSFPPEADPADDFSNWRVNVSSRDRGLLLLFLFSDVTEDDAPTRIREGSHLDVPSALLAAGPSGMPGGQASVFADQASRHRPIASAIGDAGDVYLCHPFLVHAAQGVKGSLPRLMAQPPLAISTQFDLGGTAGIGSPVEMCIRLGLDNDP